MTIRGGVWWIGLLALAAGLISGCGSFRDVPPTPEPIFVTATDDPLLLPIVATETPSPSPVATLTVAASALTSVVALGEQLLTQARAARAPRPGSSR